MSNYTQRLNQSQGGDLLRSCDLELVGLLLNNVARVLVSIGCIVERKLIQLYMVRWCIKLMRWFCFCFCFLFFFSCTRNKERKS